MILLLINIFFKIITPQKVPSSNSFSNISAFSSRFSHITNSTYQSQNSTIHRQLIDNIDISLYSNGTTIVVGEGEIRNYSSTTSPFYPHRQIIINAKIDDRIKSIGRFSFFGCDKLKRVTFGPNLHTIYESAFTNCFNLQNLYFANEYTKCSTKLFSEEPFPLNKEQTNEEEYKFCHEIFECSKNPNSKSLNCSVHQMKNSLKNNIKHQNDKSQSTNRNIKDIYTGSCGNNVRFSVDTTTNQTTISGSGPMANYFSEDSPFYRYREYIESITILDGVTSIGNHAFSFCSNLSSIAIPNSITSIGEYSFRCCFALSSITIPGSVPTIGKSAFWLCYNLTSVTILHGVTTIGDCAFQGCSSLTNITIPDSVTTIEGDAFWECSSLKSIDIPNSVTSIRFGAFAHCTNLTSITIPYGITIIEDSTFFCCLSLPNITIPNSVITIGNSAFMSCKSLPTITIPSSVESIKGFAFKYCSMLTNIIIPNSVTSMGSVIFEECISLTNVTLSNSITTIESSAFFCCFSLKNIIIPNSVTTIGLSAFARCTNLTHITIPNRVTTIGLSAFNGCSSLTSITIPGSVRSIENYAFKSCSSLIKVTYQGQFEPSFGIEVFANCSFSVVNVASFYSGNTFCGYPARITTPSYTFTNSDNFTQSHLHLSFTGTAFFSNSEPFTKTISSSFKDSLSYSNAFTPSEIFDIDTQSKSDKRLTIKSIVIITISICVLIAIVICVIVIVYIRKKSHNKEETYEYSVSDKSEKNIPLLQTFSGPTIF